MGFFSWNCKGCGHPMLCEAAANESKNGWMKDVVAIEKSGSILKGEYDGYGRIGGHEIEDYEAECYHQHCWEKAGRPTEFTEVSSSASDQGWFFEDGTHNIDPPE